MRRTANSPIMVRHGGAMRWRLALVGALAGLAWAASLRSYMVELAGRESTVEWLGTFVGVLLPGAVVGALLGLAEAMRRVGGPRGWRWLAASPLLFGVAALAMPGALMEFLRTGLGGGALGVSLIAILGGYALSGRGRRWLRLLCGALAAVGMVGGAVTGSGLQPDALALTTPRGAWVAVMFASLMLLLAMASAIPHRQVELLPAPRSSDVVAPDAVIGVVSPA